MKEEKYDDLKDVIFNLDIEGTIFYPNEDNKNDFFIAWAMSVITIDEDDQDCEFEILDIIKLELSDDKLIFANLGPNYETYRIVGLPEIQYFEFESSMSSLIEETNIKAAIEFLINLKTINFSDLKSENNNFKFIKSNETEVEKTYHSNGELKEEFETLDGERHGYYKLYHDNGQLRVILYNENGIQADGIVESFDENGSLIRSVFIKNGNLNGPFKEYYSSGKIKREGEYKDDEIIGKPIEYFENGGTEDETLNNNIVKNVENNNDFIGEIDNFSANNKIDNFDLKFKISKWYGHTPSNYSGEFQGYKFKSELLEVYKWGVCEHSYTDLTKFKNDLNDYEIEELHKYLSIDIISEDENFEIGFIEWDANTPQEFIENIVEEWGPFEIMDYSTEEEQFEIIYKEGTVINEIQLILSSADTALELHWEYSIENEKYDKVISALKHASDYDKDILNEAINKISNAHTDNDKSYDYYENGQFQEGIDSVNKALDIIPDNSGFLDTLALGYYYLGDYNLALEISNKCIEIDSNKNYQNPEHYTNRAKIYFKLNKKEPAIQDLNYAIGLDPDNEVALDLLQSLK